MPGGTGQQGTSFPVQRPVDGIAAQGMPGGVTKGQQSVQAVRERRVQRMSREMKCPGHDEK